MECVQREMTAVISADGLDPEADWEGRVLDRLSPRSMSTRTLECVQRTPSTYSC
jgi:hypothetical protein